MGGDVVRAELAGHRVLPAEGQRACLLQAAEQRAGDAAGERVRGQELLHGIDDAVVDTSGGGIAAGAAAAGGGGGGAGGGSGAADTSYAGLFSSPFSATSSSGVSQGGRVFRKLKTNPKEKSHGATAGEQCILRWPVGRAEY